MKDKNNIPKNKRKMKQKQAYERMKQMGLEGISFVTALLLNELMKKERRYKTEGFHRQ